MSKTPRKLQGFDAVPPTSLPACGFTRSYIRHTTLERTYGRRSPGSRTPRGPKPSQLPSNNDATMAPGRGSPSSPTELQGWSPQDITDVSFGDLTPQGEGNASPWAFHTNENFMYHFSDNSRLDQTIESRPDSGLGDFEPRGESAQSWHPFTAMMWREDEPEDGPGKATPPENINLYALSDAARGINLALTEAVASKDVARIRELMPRSIRDSKLTQRAKAVIASWDKTVIELLRCHKNIRCTLPGRNYAGKVASILAHWPLAYRVTEPPEISSLLRVARQYDSQLANVKSAAHAFDYDELGKLLNAWPFAPDGVAHQQGIYDQMTEDMHQATVLLQTKNALGAEEIISKLKVLAPSRHLWQLRDLQELVAQREALEQNLKQAQAEQTRDALQAGVETWPLAPTPAYQAAQKLWGSISELVQKAAIAAKERDGEGLQRCLLTGPYQPFMKRSPDAKGHTLMREWDLLEQYLEDKNQLDNACEQTGERAIDNLLELLQVWTWRKQYAYMKAQSIADIYRQGKLQHAVLVGNLDVIQKEMIIWQKFPVLQTNYEFLNASQRIEQGLSNQELMRLLHLQASDGSIIALFNQNSKPKPDVLACDERGNFPLHYASSFGVTQFLLEQDQSAQTEGKRSIMEKNKAGCPALHQVVRNLIERNAARGDREAAHSICEMLAGLKVPLISLPRDKAMLSLVHIAQLPDRWAQMQGVMQPSSLTAFKNEVHRLQKEFELVEPWLITVERKCVEDKMHLCTSLGVVRKLWEWMHEGYKAAFTSGHEGAKLKKSMLDAELAASHCHDLLKVITISLKVGDHHAKVAQRQSVRGAKEVQEARQRFIQSVSSFQNDLAEWQFIALYRTISLGSGKDPVGQWLRSMPNEESGLLWLQEPVTTLLETHRSRSSNESLQAWDRVRTCMALRADVPRPGCAWPEFPTPPKTQLAIFREILKLQECAFRNTAGATWSHQDELLKSKELHDKAFELERLASYATQDSWGLGLDMGMLVSSSIWYYNLLKLHADSAYDMLETSVCSAKLNSSFEFARGGLDLNQAWQRFVGEDQLLDQISRATSRTIRSGPLRSEIESSILCIPDMLACKLVAPAEDLRKIFLSLSCSTDPSNEDERLRLKRAEQKWETDGVMLIRVQNGYHKSCSAFCTDHHVLLHVALRLDLVGGMPHVISERRIESGETCDIEQTKLAVVVELSLVTPEADKLKSAALMATNVSTGQYDIFDPVTSGANARPQASARDEQIAKEILQAATDQNLASWEKLLSQEQPPEEGKENDDQEEEEDRFTGLRQAHQRAAGKVLHEMRGRRYPLPSTGVQCCTQMIDTETQTEGDPILNHPDFLRYTEAVRQSVSGLSSMGERVWEGNRVFQDVDELIEKTSGALSKIKDIFQEKEKETALLAEQLEKARQELNVLRRQTLEKGSPVEAERDGEWRKGAVVELPASYNIRIGPEDWKQLFEWTLPEWERDISSKLLDIGKCTATGPSGEAVNFMDAIREKIQVENGGSNASLLREHFPLTLAREVTFDDWNKALIQRPPPWETTLIENKIDLNDYHLTKSSGKNIDLANIRKMLKSRTPCELPAKAFPLTLNRKRDGAWEVQFEDQEPGDTRMCHEVRPPSKLEAFVQTESAAGRRPMKTGRTT